MKLALIADTFPPIRSSGAVQLFDLAVEIANQGHDLTVFIPISDTNKRVDIKRIKNFTVIYVKVWSIRDAMNLRRGLAELMIPYLMLYFLKKTNHLDIKWNGIIWYSPSIFFGPFIKYLKNKSNCPTYLILRDIFPDWLIDLGLIRNNLIYFFLKAIEYNQYKVADIIGVQTKSNLEYFSGKHEIIITNKKNQNIPRIEVLQNWLGELCSTKASISIQNSRLAGRKIFIYAGNMGVAQDTMIFIQLAIRMADRNDVGFVFIGRGSQLKDLKLIVNNGQIKNVEFYDEVPNSELASIFSEAVVGLLSLDPRHKNHNIPGKFLSYLRAGLPVLAIINHGNDLIDFINEKKVGSATSCRDVEYINHLATDLLNDVNKQKNIISNRCIDLANNFFSPKIAVNKIISALNSI